MIKCPFCGSEKFVLPHNDDRGEGVVFDEFDYEVECQNCGRDFVVNAEVTFDYRVVKPEEWPCCGNEFCKGCECID